MTDLYDRAIEFATQAHRGQVRKYTGGAYIFHCCSVANIVRTVPHTDEMLAAALCHDTVEDTPVTVADIEKEFGIVVATFVEWLTDVPSSAGNRNFRKRLDRERLAKAPPEVQTIKLADLIDNSISIREYDADFWKVYRREKLALLDVLKDGDSTLWARALEQCQ